MKVFFSCILALFLMTVAAASAKASDPHGHGFLPCKINEKGKGFSIEVSYPKAEGDAINASLQKFNKHIKERVEREVETFRKQAREDAEYVDKSPAPWKFALDYDLKYSDRNIISLLFSGSAYTGGAHPAPLNFTVLYDIKKEKEIAFGELFTPGTPCLKTASDFCLESLRKIVPKDELEETGAAPKEDNFKNYYMTMKGITIFFPPYQVASYASGSKEILIPFETFKGMLLPQYREKNTQEHN
jgi:hypothetical protein